MRLNRRVPNGTHGGVRGRGLFSPSYSIYWDYLISSLRLAGISAAFFGSVTVSTPSL